MAPQQWCGLQCLFTDLSTDLTMPDGDRFATSATNPFIDQPGMLRTVSMVADV